ncbi:hypothetical protein LTR70_003060 [Exophiala xenobiotica]|uniref:Uncharacterized protein n=1 Tax=Lithohypha guttulata TaxID=1690604 RepID=A0ABR0KH96_9EURO|nr:hypothetical protein LTR24_002707 [Lithohypha guttulata]KAK5323771.1 hypothetical protein LTR70_003060 [Exophiala xenobiotica]
MKTFTFLAMAAAASAHMVMKTPIPAGEPNNSPLDGSGSDYPCKGLTTTALQGGDENVMAIGAPQSLSFTGSAVHGGGSCQVSLAKGTTISPDMKFMVIHSIEGGCPANTEGNLGNNADANVAGTFQFSVPDHPDLGPGEYTLAWTWHNKVGNREMYMNCARVTVTGATKKRYAPANMPVSKRQEAPLPDMFVANIGNGCTVAEGTNVQYPNPGTSVDPIPENQKNFMAAPVGSCGAVGAANPPAGSSASSGAASATSAAAVSNSVSQVSSATSISQSAPGVFATAPPSESGAASTQASVASSATSAAVPLSTGTSSSGTSGTCEAGAWNCAADGKSFTRCVAGGTWSASIPMAAGMSCTPGVSMNFAYNASAGTNAKRDVRAHIARRRHSFRSPALS